MPVCAACGHENREGARFCDACGASLGAPAAVREERKIVTVLFVDLVGFTSRAERLDPEDVHALLAPYYARLRAELERFGGTVEKFIGDAVMALFGAPVAHEDDPERAVRAALAIRDWVRDQEEELQLRIAVATGEALVALGARVEAGEGMASGDIVNTAARLQLAAPVNGILVDETTHRATRRTIDYREHEPVELRGKSAPVPVWEALEARSRLGVDLLRRVRSPLVGRERERALLAETLVRVREERSAQLVTLVGVPGIGKSRLVYELLQAVEQSRVLMYWRQGRSLPYGEGVTHWALSEMVKAQAGILETDSIGEVEAKLRHAVGALLGESTEAAWVESQLRPLAGLAAPADAVGDRQGESFAAWRRFFEAMAEHRPLVLVFEDVHWADDGLLDFVDHLVDWATGAPILVVCTARPELLERRAGWGGGKLNGTTLSLSPLSDDETAQLFAALLGRPLLEATVQQRLLARAGGNPLYAEQYAQMQAERADADELPMPESVQGIIAARVDLLSLEEKHLLQDAAVLGKVFWLGGLVDGLARAAVEQHLHALERKGFVQRAPRSSVADDVEYAFRHVLVRDVAYGQIPRPARSAKHRHAAAWIEGLGRPEDHAEMVAHHYLSALELARAAGEAAAEIEARARLALEAAGDRAFALNVYPTAARFYEAAGELWPTDSLERARLLFSTGRTRYIAQQGGKAEVERAAQALAELGDREAAAEAEVTLWELLLRQGQREAGDVHLAAAAELLALAPATRAKANVLMHVALSHMLGGRSAEAIGAGRLALTMAEELGLGDLRAAALNISGVSRVELGDRRGIADVERAARIAREANAPYEVARAYNNLSASYHMVGNLAAARAASESCIRVAEQFGQTVWLRWQLPVKADDAYARGDWNEALRVIEAFLAEARGGHYNTGMMLSLRASIQLARGDAAGAAADAERAVDAVRRAKDPQTVNPVLAASSFVLLSAGSRTAAGDLADEYFAALKSGLGRGSTAVALLPIAWTSALLGRADELLAALEDVPESTWVKVARAFASGELLLAAELCAEMGLRPEEAYGRLRAAEALAAVGRRVDAAHQLEAALAFYRSVGAAYYVREAEALVAASA